MTKEARAIITIYNASSDERKELILRILNVVANGSTAAKVMIDNALARHASPTELMKVLEHAEQTT